MGLDSFKTEKDYPIGSVKSRKKVSNIKLEKSAWKYFAAHEPQWIQMFCHDLERSECKALVGLMDEILEDGVEGTKLSDEHLEELESCRDEIIADYIDN